MNVEPRDNSADPVDGALRRADLQAQLPQSEQNFYAAFDHCPLALTLTFVDDGRLAAVNDGFVRLSGYAREEAVGRTPEEMGLWVDPTQRAERFARLSAGEPVCDIEALFRIKGGEERIGVIGSAIVEIGGRQCVLSSVVDITEHKRTEQALRENEAATHHLLALNQAILANMGEGMYTVDTQGRLTFMNAEAERQFGWTCEELIGRRMHDVTHYQHPDGSPFPIEACAGFNVLHQGTVLTDFEDVFIRRDGSFFPVSYSSSPLRDDDGGIIGLVVVFRDITERKRGELALRRKRGELESELAATQHLQTISTLLVQEDNVDALYGQTLDAAVAIMDADFASIQMVEPTGDQLRLLGHRGFSEEAARFWAVVRPDSKCCCAFALQTGQRVITPDVLRSDAGVGQDHLEIYARAGIRAVQSTPLMSRWGRMLGMISTHWREPHEPLERDLRLFDLLARQAADLIERARGEQQLRESEENLRRANQMKDDFLATVSHELRTPLNAVLGWAQMLRSGTLRPDMTERALEALERNARAQAQLVDDLLDVSRIISGKLQIRSGPVNLAAVIASALDTLRPAANSKGVSLQVSADPGTQIVVSGDSDRLRQVVWNLISNAVKFTATGGHVEITLRQIDRQAEIVVRDTGEGIDKDFLPFVFDRFRQGDGTTTRRHAGLGLGLAIVRYLTEAHGGSVSAASEGPKQGATFTILLPLVSAPVPAPAQPPRLRRTQVEALHGIRILVVDDDADARELMRLVLESEGSQVTVVESAISALDALGQEHYDVLVADIAMPKQDGYSLIRAVRGLANPHATIPSIAMTAYAAIGDREAALKAGFDGHVAKPVDREHLIASIAAAIHLRSESTNPG
jgi:PAS domain S-box-containing protein